MSVERRLWDQQHAARALLNAAIACAVGAALAWFALVWLLGIVVNGVFLSHQTLADVTVILTIMLVLLVVRSACMWASDVIAQRSANQVKSALRLRLVRHLTLLGPSYTRGERAGALVFAAGDGVEALDEYISQYLPARVLAALVPAIVFLVIMVLDPWTLPILLFTGPILLILLALIGQRTKDLTDRRVDEMAWLSGHFLDLLQGLPALRMFGRSKEQAASIEVISRQSAATTMDVLRTAFQTTLVLEWGATAATALVAIEVSVRLMSGLIPFDRALIVLLLTPEFFLPVRQLALRYHAGSTGKSAATRIYAILDTEPPAALATMSPVMVLPATLRFDIQFRDVQVIYDDGGRVALDGLDLTIGHGQTLAIVGATGAGKTTVANVLLRFVMPSRGRVTVAGLDVQSIDPTIWRAQVGWVPQLPHLFHGTVADNIRLARPDATDAAVMAAAHAANADEFIERLPQGYATPIGEHGARLSGGQRQRLAIARAVLKDAPLLILDEPTSNLDTASERRVVEALASLMRGRTVIIITHRLDLTERVDRVAVLDAGRLVQQGDARSLTTTSGAYQRLTAAAQSHHA